MTMRPVQDWFADVAAARPDAVALSWGDRRLAYGDLARSAAAVARRLADRGVEPGDICGLACTRPDDYVTGLIGILAAGAVAMPIDPTTPDERIAQMARIARPTALLADAALGPRLRPLSPLWTIVEEIGSTCADGPSGAVPKPDTWLRPVGADAPCYVFFTSGSTGEPKGIVGRTKAVAHFVDWEIRTFSVGPDDVVAMLTSPGFDAVLRDVFTPLCAGGRIAAPPDRRIASDAVGLADWLAEAGVTLLHTTPSVLRRLLALPLRPADLPQLKRVLLAGEALLAADVEQWFARFGPEIELVNLYGPSETTMVKLFHRVTAADLGRARIPIGTPMDGCRAIVLDENLDPAGIGVVGEIYIRTPYRSLGYCNRPELTAGVFVPNPFGDDPTDLVYRTGDLGRTRDDGSLEFFGRRDDQVKIRGVRVEPAEAEAVIRRHTDVLDAVVMAHELAPGDVQLCAYLVLAGAADFNAIRAHAAERLPEAFVPTLFMRLDRIPRTLSGKVDRNALPDPRSAEGPRRRRGIPPRTPLERSIAEIWQDLLEIGAFGVTDSFFTVGGHSLLAMQVLSRVEASFAVPLPLHDFLLEPTVETLARLLEEALLAKAGTDDELQRLIDAEGLT